MKIVIAGAGEVGGHLAKMLGSEDNDITLIDPVEERLKSVSHFVDLRIIQGNSTSIEVLKKAEIQKADLFIAVNPSEEQDMNITSTILAKRMGAKKVVARINTHEYLLPDYRDIFIDLGIDHLLYPEKMAAQEIINLLAQTGASEYIDFSGKLQIIVLRLEEGAPILDKMVKIANDSSEYRVVAIGREGDIFIPDEYEEFKLYDMVYYITSSEGILQIMKNTGKENINVNSLMIVGGSPIAVMLAKALENKINVKLVESNREKCNRLAEILPKTLVINLDVRNIDNLEDEGLSSMDAFVALTGQSETNILACMAAKNAGVFKTIAEIENLNYIKLAESIGIDTVINKKIVAASRIFKFTMESDVLAIKCLMGSDAEIMEFIAKPNSMITRSKIKYINFPSDAIIGGVIRGNQAFIVNDETQVNAYDRVSIFALPSAINKVGKYFE